MNLLQRLKKWNIRTFHSLHYGDEHQTKFNYLHLGFYVHRTSDPMNNFVEVTSILGCSYFSPEEMQTILKENALAKLFNRIRNLEPEHWYSIYLIMTDHGLQIRSLQMCDEKDQDLMRLC